MLFITILLFFFFFVTPGIITTHHFVHGKSLVTTTCEMPEKLHTYLYRVLVVWPYDVLLHALRVIFINTRITGFTEPLREALRVNVPTRRFNIVIASSFCNLFISRLPLFSVGDFCLSTNRKDTNFLSFFHCKYLYIRCIIILYLPAARVYSVCLTAYCQCPTIDTWSMDRNSKKYTKPRWNPCSPYSRVVARNNSAPFALKQICFFCSNHKARYEKKKKKCDLHMRKGCCD